MAARAVRPVKKTSSTMMTVLFERQRQPRGLHPRQLSPFPHVIPMHRDIDDAGLDSSFSQRLDDAGNPPCNLDAARWNSRENYRGKLGITLDDFVRDPAESAVNGLAVHHRKGGGGGRIAGVLVVGHVFLGDLAGSH
jgi:hypothetical protein